MVAGVCGTIGLIVAFQPSLWIGLFSDDADVAHLGSLYLRIVGPAYLLFGLGLGLFYVTLGFGCAVAAMNANAATPCRSWPPCSRLRTCANAAWTTSLRLGSIERT
jgi:Na+-driven multidrug efflux pump